MLNLKKSLACLMAALIAIQSLQAQEKEKLQVGDPAPALSYSKWLQGPNPITAIDNNKVYVIEFWATWCGPCIAAMPHLSELAKKYEARIDFIGCDVWENNYGGPKDQESYLPKVSGFVKGQFEKGRLTYNVIMDNTAEDMGNNWLKAAGESGIPSSFVIDKGKIAWIGHPHYLDSILVNILAGTHDVQAERERRIAQSKKMAEMSAGYTALIEKYKAAETAKDYDKALQLVDTAIAALPDQRYMFTTDKFMILLRHFGEDKAIAYGRELQKDKLPGQVLIANLYKEDIPSKKINAFAAEATKAWGNSPKVLDILATFEARSGNFHAAVEAQQKAVAAAKASKDDDSMTESVINDMQKKVDEYRQKASGKK